MDLAFLHRPTVHSLIIILLYQKFVGFRIFEFSKYYYNQAVSVLASINFMPIIKGTRWDPWATLQIPYRHIYMGI